MAKTLKQQIRKTIKQHYGEDLWSFRADVNYGAATESFVAAISKVLKGEIEHSSDWQCDLAKYEKTGSLDIELGKRLRNIRLQKEMTLEDVAKKIGAHPDYLDDLEQGKVTSYIDILMNILESLKATHKDKTYATGAFNKQIPIEDRIRDVINLYYGRNLWALRPQFEYEESIAPFVQALVGLDQAGQRAATQIPILPTLGYMIEVEERRRKIAPDRVNSQKVREVFEAYA